MNLLNEQLYIIDLLSHFFKNQKITPSYTVNVDVLEKYAKAHGFEAVFYYMTKEKVFSSSCRLRGCLD